MNPVVTARVTEGVRSRSIDVLREIGSSTSELINAAFDYVIKEHELPRPKSTQGNEAGRRTIGKEQREGLLSFMESVKAPTPERWNDALFEELLGQALEQRYAHLP